MSDNCAYCTYIVAGVSFCFSKLWDPLCIPRYMNARSDILNQEWNLLQLQNVVLKVFPETKIHKATKQQRWPNYASLSRLDYCRNESTNIFLPIRIEIYKFRSTLLLLLRHLFFRWKKLRSMFEPRHKFACVCFNVEISNLTCFGLGCLY